MTTAVSTVTWPPDRKIWAGGLAGLVTALVAYAAKKYLNFDIPEGVLAYIPIVVGYIVSYLVPPSIRDVIKRVDDTVIAIARASDDSPASPVAPPMTPTVAKAVVDATGKPPVGGKV